MAAEDDIDAAFAPPFAPAVQGELPLMAPPSGARRRDFSQALLPGPS